MGSQGGKSSGSRGLLFFSSLSYGYVPSDACHPKPYIKLSCGLGEAPYYEKDTNKLRFFDIVNEKLHLVDLNKGPSSLESFDLATAVRCAKSSGLCFTLSSLIVSSTSADIEGNDDEILVGAKYGCKC